VDTTAAVGCVVLRSLAAAASKLAFSASRCCPAVCLASGVAAEVKFVP
jgi:hypothetical protein